MKKSLVVLGILLAGVMAQARSIECVDQKNGEVVISLTDDMGSIVRGGYTIFGASNDFFPQDQLVAYTYYYGEYLMIKEVNYDEEAVEVVAVRIPGSDKFTGFFNYYHPSDAQSIYSAKITCTE